MHKFILCLMFILFVPLTFTAQESADKVEQLRSRMSLSITQESDHVLIECLLRAKINKRYKGLTEKEIEFFIQEDEEWIELGNKVTDETGTAVFEIANNDLILDSLDKFGVMSKFKGDDGFKKSSADEIYTKAILEITFLEEDSLKTISAELKDSNSTIPDEDLGLYVESLINPLELAIETTDENGTAEFLFPNDLPGDIEGKLNVYVKLEDHYDFGNVITRQTIDWGTGFQENDRSKRSLSTTSPPLWLFFTFLAILIFIWGHYFDIIYRLYKLSKT